MVVQTRNQSRSAPRGESPEAKNTKDAKDVTEDKDGKDVKQDKPSKKVKSKKAKEVKEAKVTEDAEEGKGEMVSRDYVQGMMKTLLEGLSERSARREKKLMQMVEELTEKVELQAAPVVIDVDEEEKEDDSRADCGPQKRARMEQVDMMAPFTAMMERVAEKLDGQKKPKMDPFEEKIVEFNHGVPFPENIVFLSWNDVRVALDPKMWVMILFRKAESKTLDPQSFVYAEDSTYGPKLHELVATLQRLRVDPEDVDTLVDILRSWVYTFGVYKVEDSDFNGAYAADEQEGKLIYSRTLFATILPALKQAMKILQPYVTARVIALRGDAAGKAYENFEAMHATDLPIGAAGFVSQLSTKHLQLGENRESSKRPGGPAKCNACGEMLGKTSYREHNKSCKKRGK